MARPGVRAFFGAICAMTDGKEAPSIRYTRHAVDGDDRLLGQATVDIEGTAIAMAFVQIRCKQLKTGFQLSGSMAAGDAMPEAFIKARCPSRLNGSGPKFPEAIGFFGGKCTSGDAAASGRVADLCEDADYPLLMDKDRAKKAAADACRLGETIYCSDDE
ncbi:MAG: hypothetical protein ACI9MR_003458 [Myxococcota bacterium]|jgi:hypothetical protein